MGRARIGALLLITVLMASVTAAWATRDGSGGAPTDSLGGAPQAAPAAPRTVTFQAADGATLSGRLWGSGEVGVVLAHAYPTDQRS